MKPKLELDQHIAELLGWKNIERKTAWVETLYDTHETMYLEGLPPQRDNPVSTAIVPAFSTNAGAALDLFNSLPDDCTPRLVRMLVPPHGWQWKAAIIYGVDEDIERFDASPAFAICKAWCEWKSLVENKNVAFIGKVESKT